MLQEIKEQLEEEICDLNNHQAMNKIHILNYIMTENVSFGKVYGTTVYAPKLKSPKKLAEEFFPEFSERILHLNSHEY